MKRASLVSILIELFPAALLCALFVAVGVIHVTSRVSVVDVGYKLSRLEQERSELTREHDRLKLELATLRSPARLEQLAREKLKMAPAPAGSVITLPAEGPTPTAKRAPSHRQEQGG